MQLGYADYHQAQSLPAEFRDQRLHVIHEGIDTRLARPNPKVSFEVRGVPINRTVPTITFVNRNLERLRGFDMFMRSLPLIQRQHTQVRVLIVGDNEPGYGGGRSSTTASSTYVGGAEWSARYVSYPLSLGVSHIQC